MPLLRNLLKQMNRGWLRLLGVLLLVALVLVFKIDLRQTLELIARADRLDLALAIIFFIPFLATKAWRWQVILRDLKIEISFGEALRLYALGLGAGMVTPGQVGDAVKVAYVRERGLGRALLSVLLDRLWDVLILLLLAGTGAFLFWRELESQWLALGALVFGIFAVLVFTASPRAQNWLLDLVTRLRRSPERAPLEPLQFTPFQIARQFALTLLATVVVYFRLYLLTSALDLHLDLIPFIAAMSIATIAALLPISISGLGSRDAALLLIAPALGISREQALGISALILFLSIINGLVGFAVWLVQSKLKVRRLESSKVEIS